MFSLKEFVKKGLLDAVGKMADYQVILNATGWFEKGVLLEEDLEEINKAIEDYHTVDSELINPDTVVEEKPTVIPDFPVTDTPTVIPEVD